MRRLFVLMFDAIGCFEASAESSRGAGGLYAVRHEVWALCVVRKISEPREFHSYCGILVRPVPKHLSETRRLGAILVFCCCCASSMGTRLAFGSALKWSQHHSTNFPLCKAHRVAPIATKSRVVMSHALTNVGVITMDCTDTIMRVHGSIPR